MNTRSMMMKRTLLTVLALMAALTLLCGGAYAQEKKARKKGQGRDNEPWKLVLKPYSLSMVKPPLDFAQSLEKAKEIGYKYIEAKPGDKVGGGIEGDMDYKKMDDAKIQKILALCKQNNVKIIGYGVARTKTDADIQQMFKVCKALGAKYIVMEPEKKDLDTLDKLAQENKIAIAIHNHPEPSIYWNPETVLDAIKGHSKYIGACADTGHWLRSGLDPVECLKKLEGHIIMLHFKDLNMTLQEAGGDHKKMKDVVWGTGKCQATKMLAELKRQNFKGCFSIEYENGATCLEALPKLKAWFDENKGLTAEQLAAK